MHVRPLVLVTSFLLLAIALLTGWRAKAATRLLQSTSADLAQRQTTASAQLSATKEKASSLEQQLTEPRLAAPTSNKSGASSHAPTHINFAALLDANPELQVLQQNAKEATFNATYAAFLKKHSLSPEQREAFEELVQRYDEDTNDLWSVRSRQKLDPHDPVIRNLNQQLRNAYNAEMESLLGKPGFQDLQAYEKTVPLREMVSGLAGAATLNGTPFSPAQSEQLILLMATSSPDYQAGKVVLPKTVDWEVVDAQAALILSPEQFTAFKTLEPRGPKGAGARRLALFNAAINEAYAAELHASEALKPKKK